MGCLPSHGKYESSNPRQLLEWDTEWGQQTQQLTSNAFLLTNFLTVLTLGGKKDHIDHYSKLSVKKALTSSEMWSVRAQILNQRGKIKLIFCPLWIVMILIIMIKMTMM